MIFGFQPRAITIVQITRMAFACMQIIFVFNSERSSLSNQNIQEVSFRSEPV